MAGTETRLETFIESTRESDYMNRVQQAHRLLAQLDLERRHPDRAMERVGAMWVPALDEDTGMLLIKAAAELAAGRHNEAERQAQHIIELASTQSNRLDCCEALLLHGKACALTNRPEEAASSFEEARALAHAFPHPYAQARALDQLGRLAHQKTNAKQATQLPDSREDGAEQPGELSQQARYYLEQAHVMFQRLGAIPAIERAKQALASLA